MIVGRIRQSEICDRVISSVYCPNCNQVFNAYMMRSELVGTVVFVPVAKSNAAYYTQCPHCNLTYQFKAGQYKQLIAMENPNTEFYHTCCQIIASQCQKLDFYQQRSDKSIALASALALFGSMFGAQNWYMGHKKRAATGLGLTLLAMLMFVFAFIAEGAALYALAIISSLFLASNVYWGIIDFFRILSGHAKDGHGLYIMTKKQHMKKVAQRNLYY